MVPADSRRISRVLRYSGAVSPIASVFAYGTFTRYGSPFQDDPANFATDFVDGPTTPHDALPHLRFGLCRVRSPLLAVSLLFSLPPGNEMFQFPGFASDLVGYLPIRKVGCPIRTSALQWVFAPTRGFSQLVTSFFASESLGIPHAPFSFRLFLL